METWRSVQSLLQVNQLTYRLLTQQVSSTTRKEFLSDCTSGLHNDVYAISRTYDSVAVCMTRDWDLYCIGKLNDGLCNRQITGRIDKALIDVLPKSVRYICHNGAGYDQIDVNACTARGCNFLFQFLDQARSF